MHAAISFFFSQIFYTNRTETCMHDKCMGLCRNLTFCFVNMLNYGILWAPFLLKTLLEESPPAGARKVQRTVPGAPLLILENFAAVYPDVTCRPWVSKDGQITAKIRTP